MNSVGSFAASIVSGSILSGTSVLYATLGEIIGERAGVVNLGLEGVMLMGAVTGFAVAVETGSAAVGVLAGALCGGLFNLAFAFLVVTRRASQLASGLALMFCGVGLSAMVGARYIGSLIEGLGERPIPWLSSIPGIGPVLFKYDVLVYLVLPAAVSVWWLLFHTRWGLRVRAVGESATTAFAAGVNPLLLQYQALFVSGILAGVGGAHLSLAFTKTWAERMTAGRGFIAVALVIFSRWHPIRAVVGALVFGGAVALELQLQARGVEVSPFLLEMLPYLLSLGVLLVWGGVGRSAAPAGLGQVFRGRE